jgi:hypothetical protein
MTQGKNIRISSVFFNHFYTYDNTSFSIEIIEKFFTERELLILESRFNQTIFFLLYYRQQPQFVGAIKEVNIKKEKVFFPIPHNSFFFV